MIKESVIENFEISKWENSFNIDFIKGCFKSLIGLCIVKDADEIYELINQNLDKEISFGKDSDYKYSFVEISEYKVLLIDIEFDEGSYIIGEEKELKELLEVL